MGPGRRERPAVGGEALGHEDLLGPLVLAEDLGPHAAGAPAPLAPQPSLPSTGSTRCQLTVAVTALPPIATTLSKAARARSRSELVEL